MQKQKVAKTFNKDLRKAQNLGENISYLRENKRREFSWQSEGFASIAKQPTTL